MAVCRLLLCNVLPKTCRPLIPVKDHPAARASPRLHQSLPGCSHKRPTNFVLVVQPTADSPFPEDTSGPLWLARLPALRSPGGEAHKTRHSFFPCSTVGLRSARALSRRRRRNRLMNAGNRSHGPTVEALLPRVPGVQRISRPSQTVTNPPTPSASRSLCTAKHGSRRMDGMGKEEWQSGASHHSVPSQGRPAPVLLQGCLRRYPPHSLRTLCDVLPELSCCGVVLPQGSSVDFPESQRAGACHRCFIVSLEDNFIPGFFFSHAQGSPQPYG